jgi:hypothetical protein
MSGTVTFPATTTIQDLARSEMVRFDQDKNGQFSHEEFAAFLENFVRAVAGPQAVAGTRVASSPSVRSASSADALPPPMPGWDAVKWADPSHVTVKYVAGRIMARFRPGDWLDTGKREEIMGAFRAGGLNPTAVGLDKVDFNNGFGAIDIVQAAHDGGRAWQWLPVS